MGTTNFYRVTLCNFVTHDRLLSIYKNLSFFNQGCGIVQLSIFLINKSNFLHCLLRRFNQLLKMLMVPVAVATSPESPWDPCGPSWVARSAPGSQRTWAA